MRDDFSPLKAAVLLSRELSQARDDVTRTCLVKLINTIRRSLLSEAINDTTKLEQLIIQKLAGQKVNGKTIARLCGIAYSGRLRGALASLVKSGTVIRKNSLYYLSNNSTIDQ